jgi:hypothetical protein
MPLRELRFLAARPAVLAFIVQFLGGEFEDPSK